MFNVTEHDHTGEVLSTREFPRFTDAVAFASNFAEYVASCGNEPGVVFHVNDSRGTSVLSIRVNAIVDFYA